jgi:protein phosphatase
MKGLTDNEIDQFPYNNVIVRALGMDPDVKVDSHHEHPNPEDLYLLCSDGLTDEVEDQTIKQLLLKTSENLDNCVEALIDKAKQNGGKDNISALAVRVEDI